MPLLHARWLASSRRNSEDRAEVFERGRDLVVVVADGAGGLRGGTQAADALVEAARSRVEGPLAVNDNALDDTRSWMNSFIAVDAKIFAGVAGETTGVVVVVSADQLIGVSAGDSEAWVIDATSIDRLTESQARARLGSGAIAPIPFERRAVTGWLVVATDGLFKYAPAEEIAAAVRVGGDVAAMARRLADITRTPAGTYQDDLALVVVDLE
jgi:serine/threonine protein phosphatase PrpC